MSQKENVIVWHDAKEVLPARRGKLLVCVGGNVEAAILDKDWCLWIDPFDEGCSLQYAEIDAWAFWPLCPDRFNRPTRMESETMEVLRNQ